MNGEPAGPGHPPRVEVAGAGLPLHDLGAELVEGPGRQPSRTAALITPRPRAQGCSEKPRSTGGPGRTDRLPAKRSTPSSSGAETAQVRSRAVRPRARHEAGEVVAGVVLGVGPGHGRPGQRLRVAAHLGRPGHVVEGVRAQGDPAVGEHGRGRERLHPTSLPSAGGPGKCFRPPPSRVRPGWPYAVPTSERRSVAPVGAASSTCRRRHEWTCATARPTRRSAPSSGPGSTRTCPPRCARPATGRTRPPTRRFALRRRVGGRQGQAQAGPGSSGRPSSAAAAAPPAQKAIYDEEMARANSPETVNTLGLTFLAPTVMVLGTEAQKTEIIGPMLRNEVIWCQGFSEPGAGSDLASLTDPGRARRRPLRRQRAEGLDDERDARGPDVHPGAHHHRGRQARRHHHAADRHARRGRRGPAAAPDERRQRVRRGVPHRRPGPRRPGPR